jgi:hypothetical protein
MSGVIVWFDPYDGGPIEMLPVAQTRPATLGDQFPHVFVWDGAIHVGTARELWEVLAPHRDSIEQHAPLTLVDLAEGAHSEELPYLAQTASTWLEGRYGAARAERWRTGTYFRGIVLRELRLLLGESANAGPIRQALQHVDVHEAGRSLLVRLPGAILDKTGGADMTDVLRKASEAFHIDNIYTAVFHLGDKEMVPAIAAEKPPTNPDDDASISPIDSWRTIEEAHHNLEEIRWLLVAFGARAIVAVRGAARQRQDAMHLQDYINALHGIKHTDQPADKVSVDIVDVHDTIQKIGNQKLTVLIVFDATPDATHAALTAAHHLPDNLSAHGAVIYRTSDGLPNLPDHTWPALTNARLPGTTVVPDNEISASDAPTSTTISRVLSALIATFNHLGRTSMGASGLPEGVSSFSIGWTSGGVRDVERALLRSIAAGTNPWLPPYTADSAHLVLTSVGHLEEEMTRQIRRDFNDFLVPPGNIRPPLEISWQRRSFLVRANVPATASIITTNIRRPNMPAELAVLQAARTMLSVCGYEIGQQSAAELGDSPHLVVSGNRSAPLIVMAPIGNQLWGIVPNPPEYYVQLVMDRSAQRRILRQELTWRQALPLLYSDLFYLRGASDPVWAARLLAHLAHPKRLWPIVLRGLVEEAVRCELAERPERHALYVPYSKTSKSGPQTLAKIEIQVTGRLPGRGARIEGSLIFHVEKAFGGSPITYEHGFAADLRPEGFRLINPTAGLSPFDEPGAALNAEDGEPI